jgi:hypothetical protein
MSILLNPIRKLAGKVFGKGPEVDGKTRLARLAKCYTCPQLYVPTRQCKKCTCFVDEKVKYQLEKCGIGKW